MEVLHKEDFYPLNYKSSSQRRIMADAKESKGKEPKKSKGKKEEGEVPPGETKKKGANPLPYIIIFALLFLVALGVLSWALSVFYKASQCNLDPTIWCSDNWTCQNACTLSNPDDSNTCQTSGGQPVDPCFCKNINSSGGITGMASCITTAINSYCAASPDPTTGDCACPAPINAASNCLKGCPNQLSQVNPNICTTQGTAQ